MKKIGCMLVLGSLLGLVSCAHMDAKRNVASDEGIQGNETGNRMEELEGIIKQAECNKPTGLGTIELEVKSGKTVETTWYKVNSQELCSREIESELFLGKATVLTDLSSKNVTHPEVTITKVQVSDGFVTGIEAVKKVDYAKYMKNVQHYESNGNNREVLNWYFQNRKGN